MIDKEIDGVNSFLDTFPKVKKVTVLQGNHDLWLDEFAEQQGHKLFKKYLFKNAIKIKERKWHYRSYDDDYKVGRLYFCHGRYTVKYHAFKMVSTYGENVMYGHCHDVQRHSVPLRNGCRAGFSIGNLKKMDAESNRFLRGNKHNWGHACAVVDFNEDGTFRADTIDITNGTTNVWGKHIEGIIKTSSKVV
jgi:hypothetical protein